MSGSIIQVAVPRPLRRLFDYEVPPQMPVPQVGARVKVPFGRSQVVGIVTGLTPRTAYDVKPVSAVIDAGPLLPDDLIELASWLARYYHHPLGEVYATVLPSAARRGRKFALSWPRVWEAVVKNSSKLERAPRQRQALEALCRLGSAVPDAQVADLGIDRRALNALLEKGLVVAREARPEYRIGLSPVTLTAEQEAAVTAINATPTTHVTHLLEGVTGSGKTEVYMQVIANVVERGQQALVLVPEIALTPQTLARFRDRFGSAAALHSAEADTVRFDTWMKCMAGHHKILIGTRSAVFTPFENLGLIVIDEEHDASFKQQDGLRYSARDVAVKRGQLLGVPVVLGSATPSLDTLANVDRGRYRHAVLTTRATGARMPDYHVIDIRGQRLPNGLSDRVIDTARRHLSAGNQVLVFINRRGFAPTCLCTDCGWQAICAECDTRLTLHEHPRGLRCHQCDRRYRFPEACPDCSSPALIALGTGTQRVDAALSARFPEVPLYRIDRDTTRSQRRLNEQLDAIRTGQPAILVGTQMLAKGHHLPAVTLVAVIDADSGFLSADFRAPERTAQLITQVAGRAGRAERPGEVWIQTFDPNSPNLRALIDHGYRGFAATEAQLRRDAGMPPYASMAILRSESSDDGRATNLLRQAAAVLTGDVEVIGPTPAPLARRGGRFRHQCLVLARRRSALHDALNALERAQLNAANVRWSIDVDPLDTF